MAIVSSSTSSSSPTLSLPLVLLLLEVHGQSLEHVVAGAPDAPEGGGVPQEESDASGANAGGAQLGQAQAGTEATAGATGLPGGAEEQRHAGVRHARGTADV